MFKEARAPGPVDHGTRHHFASEEAVNMLRRTNDELVSLLWFIKARLDDGVSPEKLAVDTIYDVLDLDWIVFECHRPLLNTLNEVTNAHKHSFIQSDLSIVGEQEPSDFLADVFADLAGLAERLRAAGAT